MSLNEKKIIKLSEVRSPKEEMIKDEFVLLAKKLGKAKATAECLAEGMFLSMSDLNTSDQPNIFEVKRFCSMWINRETQDFNYPKLYNLKMFLKTMPERKNVRDNYCNDTGCFDGYLKILNKVTGRESMMRACKCVDERWFSELKEDDRFTMSDEQKDRLVCLKNSGSV
jgi:hypothetical protein